MGMWNIKRETRDRYRIRWENLRREAIWKT
jgi:hypothetical protein